MKLYPDVSSFLLFDNFNFVRMIDKRFRNNFN